MVIEQRIAERWIITAGGFSAEVVEIAYTPAAEGAVSGQLHYLSMVGAKEAVRAIGANLLKANAASGALEKIGPNGLSEGYTDLVAYNPWMTKKGSWKQLRPVKLPESGAYHSVVHSRILESGFTHPDTEDKRLHETWRERARQFAILPRSDDEAANLYIRFLSERVNIPLHPLWANTLWQAARSAEDEEITSLATVGDFEGYLCSYDPETLTERIRMFGRMEMLWAPPSAGGSADLVDMSLAAD